MAAKRKKKAPRRRRLVRQPRIHDNNDVQIHGDNSITYRFKGGGRRGKLIVVGADGGITIGNKVPPPNR